ncbi:hypothetical protein [Bacillus sp. ISL-7]|nr:hypothetical protein [Bacillus sp. ISL-7]
MINSIQEIETACEWGQKPLKIILAIYQSVRTGLPVEIVDF